MNMYEVQIIAKNGRETSISDGYYASFESAMKYLLSLIEDSETSKIWYTMRETTDVFSCYLRNGKLAGKQKVQRRWQVDLIKLGRVYEIQEHSLID